MNQFSRTELLIGSAGRERLKRSKVVVYGVGGVGSYAVEALARAGIGHLVLVDYDEVSVTNINRQLVALHSTIGRKKVDVLKERILDINPQAEVILYPDFIGRDNVGQLVPTDSDYLVDAVDNVTAKLALIERARELDIPIISAMGAGNRLDPTKLTLGDISETDTDPLARVMRRELRKRGITKGLKVVYSRELPFKTHLLQAEGQDPLEQKNSPPGSISFVPPVAGMLIASAVVRDLLAADRKNNT